MADFVRYSSALPMDSTDEEQTSGSGSEEVEAHRIMVSSRVLRHALVASIFGAVAAGCLMATAAGHRVQARSAMARAGVEGAMQLFDPSQIAAEVSDMPQGVSKVAEEIANLPGVAKVLDKMLTSEEKGCSDNEEIFLGLCYKKCALLTDDEYPMRSAAEMCCKTKPCLLPSEVQSKGFFPCSGYDISGSDGCPHAPGNCDDNEEYHLGLCYKKCELVSLGQFPIRVAANTCCKAKPCWNIFNLKTEGLGCNGFGVGGGTTEGHQCAHKPE